MNKVLLVKLLLIFSFVSLFSACTNTQTDSVSVFAGTLPEIGTDAVDGNQQAEKNSEPESQPSLEEDIVYGNFPEDILTRVIVAEMAGQRGYNQTALTEYLALAQETNDLGIIRRATLIAAFLSDNAVSLELNKLWLEQEPNSEEALKTSAYHLIKLNRLSEALALFALMHELDYEIDYRLISNRADNSVDSQLFLNSLVAEFETLLLLSRRVSAFQRISIFAERNVLY